MSNKRDLANAILDEGLSAESDTLKLESGYGSGMPDVPYKGTLTPFGELPTRGNSEIVKVTDQSGDTLTIERAQNETSAKAFSEGAIFSNGVYVEDIPSRSYIEGLAGGTVVESDESSHNGYIRFNNGIQIAWRYWQGGASTSSWVAPMYQGTKSMGDWKKPFDKLLTVSCTGDTVSYLTETYGANKNKAGTLYYYRPNSSEHTVGAWITGIGTWS